MGMWYWNAAIGPENRPVSVGDIVPCYEVPQGGVARRTDNGDVFQVWKDSHVTLRQGWAATGPNWWRSVPCAILAIDDERTTAERLQSLDAKESQ